MSDAHPTLFQCMVRSHETVYELRRVFTNALEHSSVSNVRPRVPGSLGQDMHDPHSGDWVFGSLTMTVCGFSVFVFRNGKIKISGGSKAYSSGDYRQWLDQHVVTNVMRVLHELNENETEQNDYTWDLCLLNGSMNVGKLRGYKRVCEHVCRRVNNNGHPFFLSATMPVCYQPNGWLKRGRVCSIAVKFRTTSRDAKPATARFDHGGRVQFFALKCIEDLHRASEELRALVIDLQPKDRQS